MRSLVVLLALAVIGPTTATTADRCPGSPRQFLATVEGGGTPVLIRRGETVQLLCRPPNDEGCRWTTQRGTVIGDRCELTADAPGVVQCRQGGNVIGSVELKYSSSTTVYPERFRDRGFGYRPSTEEERRRLEEAYTCSDTGKLIEQGLLCDGRRTCNNGEDETNCAMTCGAPSLGDGSSLTMPAVQQYPLGASVTYTCQPGRSFRETLGEYRRTCRRGYWSGSPPACLPNLAFGRPATVSAGAVLGLGPELAVDGQVSTWAMLTPGEGDHSLNVTLPNNASVELVLVRTLSPSYEVALVSGNSRAACRCNRSQSDDIGLSGQAVCACPSLAPTGTDAGSPLILEIRSTVPGLTSLSVSEIAAFEAPSSMKDACALLDPPAHGRFERTGDSAVRLVCDEGYRASCAGELTCAGMAPTSVCRPVTCPPAPAIPRAVIGSNNGTSWWAVTEYRCAPGYQLYPLEQRTRSVCRDGLWSLSHVFCLPESDLRVVALRLGQQHARSVATLGAELKTLMAGQLKLLQQMEHTQQRLRLVEQMLNVSGQEMVDQYERLEAIQDRQEEMVEMEEGEEREEREEEEREQEEEEREQEEEEREQEVEEKDQEAVVDSGFWGI